MGEIQFAIEGQGATEATKMLLEIPGISGNWQSVNEVQKGITIATIATFIGITGGVMGIAEQIRKWHQEWKKGKDGKKIEKVVIIGKDGKRFRLEDATLEDISKVLEGLIEKK